jgi:hypothetical protein
VRQFTVEDITFDYNLRRLNMDGVHLNGNCHHGRIANLKGATNDDMVALNADDGSMYELSRGPITDIQIDGLWAESGYTGVRLLSAGSPVDRVRISNIFGTYRVHVVSFTNHDVHPGEASEIGDVVVDGIFCSKPLEPLGAEVPDYDAARFSCPLLWVESGTRVRNLLVQNLVRTEALEGAPPCLQVAAGAHVDHLSITSASVTNLAATPLDFLVNEGAIESLNLLNVDCRAVVDAPRSVVLRNAGTVGHRQITNTAAHNLAALQ